MQSTQRSVSDAALLNFGDESRSELESLQRRHKLICARIGKTRRSGSEAGPLITEAAEIHARIRQLQAARSQAVPGPAPYGAIRAVTEGDWKSEGLTVELLESYADF